MSIATERDLLSEGYPHVLLHGVTTDGRYTRAWGAPHTSVALLRRLWTRGGVPFATLEPITISGEPRGKFRSTWDLRTGRSTQERGLFGQICFWSVTRARGVLILGDLRALHEQMARKCKTLHLDYGGFYELAYEAKVLRETPASRASAPPSKAPGY